MMVVVVVAVLGAWFACTAITQVPAFERLRSWDHLGVIPNWRFFAPQPATMDFHLVFRDRLPDHTVTPWTEVTVSARRRFYNGVWNPGRRERKALFDAVTELARIVRDTNGDLMSVQLSVPYLTLLVIVSELPRQTPGLATQFAVMVREGRPDARPSVLFMSNMHEL